MSSSDAIGQEHRGCGVVRLHTLLDFSGLIWANCTPRGAVRISSGQIAHPEVRILPAHFFNMFKNVQKSQTSPNKVQTNIPVRERTFIATKSPSGCAPRPSGVRNLTCGCATGPSVVRNLTFGCAMGPSGGWYLVLWCSFRFPSIAYCVPRPPAAATSAAAGFGATCWPKLVPAVPVVRRIVGGGPMALRGHVFAAPVEVRRRRRGRRRRKKDHL